MPCSSQGHDEVPEDSDPEDSDPGMIFSFNSDDEVHACVGLAGDINPPIQQGKNNIWQSWINLCTLLSLMCHGSN